MKQRHSKVPSEVSSGFDPKPTTENVPSLMDNIFGKEDNTLICGDHLRESDIRMGFIYLFMLLKKNSRAHMIQNNLSEFRCLIGFIFNLNDYFDSWLIEE